MPHPIFYVVSKDIEKQHIATNVQPSRVQKHSGDNSQVDRIGGVKWEMRWHSRQRCLGNPVSQCHRDNRIREHKGGRIRAKRHLVEKDHDVYGDNPPCYPRKAPSRPRIVLDRDHLFTLIDA